MHIIDLNDIPVRILTEIFNALTGKRIKKFQSRPDAENRTMEVIDTLQADPIKWHNALIDMGEHLSEYLPSDDKSNPRFDRMTMREKAAVASIYTCGKHNALESVDILSLKGYMRADHTALTMTLQRLAKRNIIKVLPNREFTLFESTREWVIPIIDDFTEETDFRKVDFAHPGKRSEYSGKRLYKLVEGNPFREGTHKHTSWLIITEAMTFEDYRRNRGRTEDVRQLIRSGHLQAK